MALTCYNRYMIKKICIGCEIQFETKGNKPKYCSRECYFENVDPKERLKSRRSYSGNSNPFYGKHQSIQARKKISKANKGKKLSEETIKKIKLGLNNEKCYAWKGGISADWWHKRVLERDDYTCKKCGLKDEEVVEADHIKPASEFPELKHDLNNGMTLCANCHRRKSKLEHRERMKRLWKQNKVR